VEVFRLEALPSFVDGTRLPEITCNTVSAWLANVQQDFNSRSFLATYWLASRETIPWSLT